MPTSKPTCPKCGHDLAGHNDASSSMGECTCWVKVGPGRFDICFCTITQAEGGTTFARY